jgi:hypothetical protein
MAEGVSVYNVLKQVKIAKYYTYPLIYPSKLLGAA